MTVKYGFLLKIHISDQKKEQQDVKNWEVRSTVKSKEWKKTLNLYIYIKEEVVTD